MRSCDTTAPLVLVIIPVNNRKELQSGYDWRLKLEKIAIYGAGDFGKRMLVFLKTIGCEVSFFIQSEDSDRKEYEGVPIISVTEYFRKKHECLVFIAIQDAKVVNQVVEIFNEKKDSRNKVFDCRMFIDENLLENTAMEGGEKECILCGHRVKEFLPAGINTPLSSSLKVIGGGYRNNALCPLCGCLDRNRWVYWVLKEKTDIFIADRTVLHFAPEKMIQKKMQNNVQCDYYAGDIVLRFGEHRIDVTKIPFRDDFFDYILINHVMEHIEEEEQAFRELRRVIKPNGKVVLSFPITLETETIEKEGVCSEADRLKYYGQKDHVRLYGKDYKERLEAFGWEVQRYTPEDIMSKEQIQRYGFLWNDILLICSQRE